MIDTMIWITGASSGIGRALVETVPVERARIIDISRSGGAPGTEHVPADLADPSSWTALEAHLVAQLGEFDGDRAVFVHSAATIEPVGFAGEADSEPYRRNALLNAAAPLALGHAFLKACAGFAGEAQLVMLTSGAARNPYEGWSGYSAGKAAVDAWVRAVAAEQAQRGTRARVVAIAPGVVATPMQARIRATGERDFPHVERFRRLHDDGALRDPADAARDIWKLLQRPDLAGGPVVDLREIAG